MSVRALPTAVRRPESVSSVFPENLKSRFLHGLAKPDLDSVLAAATPRRCFADSVVVNQDEPAEHFFLLTKGHARHFFLTPEGRKVLLLWLGPGEVFGGATFLSSPSSYLLGTEMVEDSWVLVWQRRTIRELAARYPQLMGNALSIAGDYLTWFLAAHVALISHSARERVAGVLVSLAEGMGRKVSGGVKLDITNEQLANAANVTPFTASRLLSEWQRNGAVVKSRGGVVLRALERLFVHQV
jgi:CRP/FNR family transcriptional regulator, nitrogen oxide reductase regulator